MFAPDLAGHDDTFDRSYFEWLEKLEASNFWFKARNRLIIWALGKYFPHCKSFLEIGCGTGYVLTGLSQSFPEIKMHGTDIFHEALAFSAQRMPEAILSQVDARNIPYDSEFDVIGAFDVLEHIPEDQKVLQEMYRACRPSGGLILSVPQHQQLWSPSDDFAKHCRRYQAGDLKAKLRLAGFSVLHTTSFVSLLLPLMILSRARQKFLSGKYDVRDELEISGWVGAVLEKVMNAERRLIESGCSLPAGGSLLAVAQRPAGQRRIEPAQIGRSLSLTNSS